MAENVPEPTQSFEWVSDFIAPGFGVFLGVIAGALIQFGLQWLYGKIHEKRSLKNLKFELQFNIRKLDGLIKEVGNLRDSVNANAVSEYFGYFKTTGCLLATVDDMLHKGLLYKHLTHDDILKLQEHYTRLSTSEAFYNQKVADIKASTSPKEKLFMVNFIQGQFITAKQDLEIIHNKIKD